jgi:hypothetical protein
MNAVTGLEGAYMRRKLLCICLAIGMCCGGASGQKAQQAQKPLTNEDVIAMVKNHMAESVVISAIESSPAKFNTSTAELIRLKNLGVTEKEMNAMLAESKRAPEKAPPSSGAGPSAEAANEIPAPKSRMPKLYVIQGGGPEELVLEKTQLAETKTKPSSMKNLAADSAVTQAMQAGVNTATYSAATHLNSGGGSAMQEAGSVFSGVMSRRKPMVTYVWGVPSPASKNVLQTVSPIFSLDFSRTTGVNADDYEPAIVKLTPAQNTCRIVGATQGKEDIRSSPAADWKMYSHFLEERVSTRAQRLDTGKYKVSTASDLQPGEYAVVLRPTSKDKKFSGGDVTRAQGDGLMFDAVWTFQISEEAQ